MSLFEIGQYFPHPDHMDRIERYRKNKKLFKGFHYEVFQQKRAHLSTYQKDILYISANLPALICKKSADFLFGEPVTYDAGGDENSEEQKTLERFDYDNDMNILNYESSLGCAFRGDSFYKIRWGQRWGGKVDADIDPFRVFIEAQNPEYVFPETLPGDAKEIFAYHIAYPEEVKGMKGQEYILHIESHYPGLVTYRKRRMNPIQRGVNGEITLYKIYAELDTYTETETGVPYPLVVHTPNFALEDSWEGIDDLTEHHSLLDEINMRLSLIAEILDKHSDPAMAVPVGSLDIDEQGNPVFFPGRDKIFEYEKGEAEPKYITWNGQLDAAFRELDKLLDYLLITAEIPPVVLGKDNSGTSGSSGAGIKQRMNSLLLKVKRKRQYYEKALRRVLLIAQLLEHSRADDVNYEIVERPRILFNERLADDEMEKATISQIRTGGKPTKSRKSILMEEYGLTEDQAEKELQRIEEDEKELGFVDSSIFQKDVEITDIEVEEGGQEDEN